MPEVTEHVHSPNGAVLQVSESEISLEIEEEGPSTGNAYSGMSSFQSFVPEAPILTFNASSMSQFTYARFNLKDCLPKHVPLSTSHLERHICVEQNPPSEDLNVDSDVIKDINIDGEDCIKNPGAKRIQPEVGTSNMSNTLGHKTLDGKLREAPTQLIAKKALDDLQKKLWPRRKKGSGYTDPGLDIFVRTRMEGMQAMLNLYTSPQSFTFDKWGASSCQAAITLGRGVYCARQLRKLNCQFIMDHTLLPINPFSDWNESMLVDEDLVSDINLYLQELGSNGIMAQKIVGFLAREDIREKHGITKTISETTAQRYLKTLGYCWSGAKKGQYADGHERDDVIWYREKKFLPQWKDISSKMHNWTKDNLPEDPSLPGHIIIVWFHDESIFYAHDRRKRAWYHKDALAKPYAKGDGASLMIADYVSADFGWLQSPDGQKNARQIMRPGKNKDGYFSSTDIQEQANSAMDILTEYYPEYDHVFIYDNVSTHLKHVEGSLSARKMPKKPTFDRNWGVEVTKRDESGKLVYKPDGTLIKIKIKMRDAQFTDGKPQPLYFPEGHKHAGIFKGMAQILEERGFQNIRSESTRLNSSHVVTSRMPSSA